MTDPEGKTRGQCNCGKVAFEISAVPGDVIVCHCSICRRATGSNGIAVILVDKVNFRWSRGEEQIATWKKPDADWQTWFCRECGSPLPGENSDTSIFIPAGLVDDASLTIAHHIWVDSKAAWDSIGDDGKQHPGAYSG